MSLQAKLPQGWASAIARGGIFAFGLCGLASSVQADDNDLVLSRLGYTNGTVAVGANAEFRSLASELGVVLAPRLTEPADTLGWGGFEFLADTNFTSISNDASYWQVLESSSDPNQTHGSGSMRTTGLFVRKGMWLPLPSFEMGIGAVHLHQSRIWAGQGYLKFALHEGYHDTPLPSLAVRGGVSRMTGSEQLDLTIVSIDTTVSKDFGIAGTFALSPYLGWNWLIIVPRSEVIDKTPNIDPRDTPGDGAMNFVFSEQDNILRQRFFAGAKFKYQVFTLGLELAYALSGSSVDDRGGTDMDCATVDPMSPTDICDATDRAGSQTSLTTTLGIDF